MAILADDSIPFKLGIARFKEFWVIQHFEEDPNDPPRETFLFSSIFFFFIGMLHP